MSNYLSNVVHSPVIMVRELIVRPMLIELHANAIFGRQRFQSGRLTNTEFQVLKILPA